MCARKGSSNNCVSDFAPTGLKLPIHPKFVQIMESLSIYHVLARKGLRKKDLNLPIKKEHRDRIAVKLGPDWKECAIELALSEEDVQAIVKENKWSRNRRLAMMQRWGAAQGPEATYMRLAQALLRIGREDLVEYSIDLFIQNQGFLFRRLGEWTIIL